jgi:hypothetical protein
MIGVAEKLFYGECVEIQGNLDDLTVNNDLAAWASGRPLWRGWERIDGKPDGRSVQAMTDALKGGSVRGKLEKGEIGPRPIIGRKDGVLDRQPPWQVRLLNARAVMDICALHGITEVSGRFGADGIKVYAPTEQRQSFSDLDELLLNGYLDCDFGYHDRREGWRGWTLIILTWLDAPDRRALVVGWVLIPASEREFTALSDLLRKTNRAWDAERNATDPRLFIEHLGYDSGR